MTFEQVLASGGPQPESTVEFRHENATVGVVSQNGVIEARTVGQTVIGARAIGFDAHSRHVVYSEVNTTSTHNLISASNYSLYYIPVDITYLSKIFCTNCMYFITV